LHMTIVSNDPSWWPENDVYRFLSYSIVASSAMVTYDWVLTFGQEVDLVWRKRWSLMTFLYLSVRYIGILYSANMILWNLHTVLLTDKDCSILDQTRTWASVIANVLLCVIMISRLYAMYQRSRKMLIFLVVIFLALTIASVVIIAILNNGTYDYEVIVSGTYQCGESGYQPLLTAVTWMLGTVWEVLALCLAAWIAVKHFRELQPTGWAVGNCLTVLIKSHVLYFSGFTAAACLILAYSLSPKLWNALVYGFLQIASFAQMFVLGPRLILSIRDYHAELVENSDVGTSMTTIAFQERVLVTAGDDVV